MKIYKTNWYEHKPEDNNSGFIFGIVLNDDNDNFIEVFWYTSEKERDYKYDHFFEEK